MNYHLAWLARALQFGRYNPVASCKAFIAHLVGGNPATARQACKAVSDFLQTLCKLG